MVFLDVWTFSATQTWNLLVLQRVKLVHSLRSVSDVQCVLFDTAILESHYGINCFCKFVLFSFDLFPFCKKMFYLPEKQLFVSVHFLSPLTFFSLHKISVFL